jgi:hypothetical protein
VKQALCIDREKDPRFTVDTRGETPCKMNVSSPQAFAPIWQKALGDETAFDELVSPQVTLEGSILRGTDQRARERVDGRASCWRHH